MIVAGVDGGGSKTHIVLADDTGRIVASATGGASAVDATNAKQSAQVIVDLVRAALDSADMAAATVNVLCAGLAGTGRDDARKAVTRALKSHEIAEQIIVTTDAQIALDDAFGDGPGVLLIAGTGSIAFARSPTDEQDRCGGWGPILGDEGSALWLGRRALNSATAAADGREAETALLGALLTATECTAPADLVAWAARASNADIAALTPIVLSVAETGDLRANTLVTIAAEELVLHVRTLARRLFGDERAAIPVAMSGGLLSRGSLMRRVVEHRFRSAVPGAVMHRDEINPARGAVRMALRHTTAART